MASIHKSPKCASALIRFGANASHIAGRERNSVAHYAARSGAAEIIKMLTSKGADMNHTNLVRAFDFTF